MRVFHGHKHCLLEKLLGSIKSDDVCEANVGVCIDDFPLERFSESLQVGVVAIVGEGLDDSIFEVLLRGFFSYLLAFLLNDFLPFLLLESSLTKIS